MGRALMYPLMGLAALVVIALVVYGISLLVMGARERQREANDEAVLAAARWRAFQRPERGEWALGVECVAELSSGPARRFPDEEVQRFPFSTDEFTLELCMADKKDLAHRMNIAADQRS